MFPFLAHRLSVDIDGGLSGYLSFPPRFECHKIHCHTSYDMTASKYTEYWRMWLIFNNQL
ncbi:Uncharacterised protein [Escherichia coli]|uniref:Uncharacterized protein n=1 Tax=Escherichia coli TaxID=562 RepID=A0A2X3JIZ7_ECOLX|nr:Uncharacterised protein [Escherichia coli]